MARPASDELSGTMVVLGLVLERPNATVSDLGDRLHQRFRRARFSRSLAYNALPKLAQREEVRCTYRAPGENRGDRARDRYEATQRGTDAFRSWMLDVPSGVVQPALRDAMDGRLELCRVQDIPRMIEIARREAAVAADLYAAAHDVQRRHASGKYNRFDFERRLREVLLILDPDRWSARVEHYKKMVEMLEEIQHDMERARTGDE